MQLTALDLQEALADARAAHTEAFRAWLSHDTLDSYAALKQTKAQLVQLRNQADGELPICHVCGELIESDAHTFHDEGCESRGTLDPINEVCTCEGLFECHDRCCPTCVSDAA